MKEKLKDMGETKKGFETYELDSAGETLMRAKEIKKDSEMMSALRDHAKKKWKVLAEEVDEDDSEEIKSIDDIKKKSQKKFVKEY